MSKKTKTTSMGNGAGILGGIANAFIGGAHSYKTTGKNGVGYGHTPKQSHDNYNAKSCKKKR